MFRHLEINTSRSMINDSSRNRWYRDIIKETVKDKVIFEIGTGIGLLGAYCLEYGASHYYGIDIRSSRAKIARHILDELGYQGKHTILTGDFLSLSCQDIPQSIDILLCEYTGYQFTNDFSVKKFWSHANKILKTPYQSIPEKWSVDVRIYEGLIDGDIDEYQPAIIFDDPSLPTGFHTVIENLDFVKPTKIIKDMICCYPHDADQEIMFDLDLSGYKSATIVINDRISYRDSDCLAPSYLVDWPSPSRIMIPEAGGVMRFQWDKTCRNSDKHTNGFWKWYQLPQT